MREPTKSDERRAAIVAEYEKRKAELEAEYAARKKNIEPREQRTARLVNQMILIIDPTGWIRRREKHRRDRRLR
jgi:hypothetical protein